MKDQNLTDSATPRHEAPAALLPASAAFAELHGRLSPVTGRGTEVRSQVKNVEMELASAAPAPVWARYIHSRLKQFDSR